MSEKLEEAIRLNNKTYERGIFGNSPNPEARIINDFEQLEQYVNAIRTLGLEIVLTSGTFDLLHIGHAKYLEEAKRYGDILIVGVDSDEKVKNRKGPDRPIVPEDERSLILAHLRSVDIITVKKAKEPRWELIKMIHPDTLVVTQETYSDEEIKQLGEFCGQVINMAPQATTSTSANIRKTQIGFLNKVVEPTLEMMRQDGVSEKTVKKIGKFLLERGHDDQKR